MTEMPRFNRGPYSLLRLVAALAILAAGAPHVGTAELLPVSDAEGLLADIQARATTIDTLAATFRQHRFSRLLREPLVSEGLIYFQRNGKTLIQIDTPEPSQILIQGQSVTIVNPAMALVRKTRLSGSDRMLQAWLAGGAELDNLKQQYDLRLAQSSKGDRYTLQMTPKDSQMARHIASVEIQVHRNVLLPEQIVITTPKGDRTTMQMRVVSLNEPLPAGIFDIVVPEVFQNDR